MFKKHVNTSEFLLKKNGSTSIRGTEQAKEMNELRPCETGQDTSGLVYTSFYEGP